MKNHNRDEMITNEWIRSMADGFGPSFRFDLGLVFLLIFVKFSVVAFWWTWSGVELAGRCCVAQRDVDVIELAMARRPPEGRRKAISGRRGGRFEMKLKNPHNTPTPTPTPTPSHANRHVPLGVFRVFDVSIESFTPLQTQLVHLTGFYINVPSFTRCYLGWPSFTGFYPCLLWLCLVLLSFTYNNLVLPCLPSSTKF